MTAPDGGDKTVVPFALRAPEVPPDVPELVQTHKYLHWRALDGDPPEFIWLLDHWLSWHPTLLAGRGGIGKSLLIQQLGTCLACGLPTWCGASAPVRVLYWACEDDHDQLWRREDAICRQLKIGFDRLDNFYVDARLGLENTLLSTEYGRPMWTPTLEVLRDQVNDLAVDVLLIDNIGHTFGGNENARYDVTLFVNRLVGLVTGRPFCPILLGHPSKSINSEYSGSTAWENAVRMRWYLNDRLPDDPAPDAPPDPNIRILAKRKTNYTALDYQRFNFTDGVLVAEPRETGDSRLMAELRQRKARSVIVYAVPKLAEVGIFCNNAAGRNYLPAVILDNRLAEGCTKGELKEAMSRMILDKELTRDVLGKTLSRHPITGLKCTITS